MVPTAGCFFSQTPMAMAMRRITFAKRPVIDPLRGSQNGWPERLLLVHSSGARLFGGPTDCRRHTWLESEDVHESLKRG